MAIISESFTENGVSLSVYPGEVMSDVIIDGEWEGRVFLECLAPGSSEWVRLWETSTDAAVIASSPDSGISYRFKVTLISGSVNVYFGP